MFKGLWLWIRGLFGLGAPVEETPKLSKESIDRVGKIIEEIKREAISVHSVGQYDRAAPTSETEVKPQGRPFVNTSKEGFGKVKTVESLTIQRGADGPIEAVSIDGKRHTVTRAGVVANFDHAGNLLSVGADHDGHMEPTQRTFHSGVEMSFIAEPGIDSKLLIERLNDPKPVPVSLSELGGDTPVPVQRKPRRRGKRGGRGRNKNKK